MITTFHGIGAYRGQKNPMALRSQLNTALSGVEICCADRPIGAFGAIVLGDCRAVYDRDVWSLIEENGQRAATNWYDECIEQPDQFSFEEFAASQLAKKDHPRSYVEAWVSPTILRAIWVKDWAPAATVRAAAIIAKHRRVPLVTVSGTTRIWDVLDAQKLPFTWSKSA